MTCGGLHAGGRRGIASTDPEAFGRVITEAQAMGRPVVATDQRRRPRNDRAGAHRLLAPPHEPGGAADAVGEALRLDTFERAGFARAQGACRGKLHPRGDVREDDDV